MKRNGLIVLVAGLLAAMVLSACDLAPKGAGQSEDDQNATATGTPVVTSTPVVTGTLEGTETAEATEGARAGCPGNPAEPPPPLGTLATTFSLSQDTVLNYWCQGFGIGEIKKALTWAKLTGTEAQALFDLKKQGMGWGQIAKKLGIHPGKNPDKHTGKPDDTGKPDKPDKPDKP